MVGIPDPQWGERPIALVVCVPGETLVAKALETHLLQYVESGRINKWAIPRQIRFVDDIPKTSVGKMNKRLIREEELARQAS
ncbi:Long-chain-fatty-acid--CoA ligase [compost metagenome]